MKLEEDLFYKKHTICCKGSIIDLTRPKVMGIINLTPDSFYAGSRQKETSKTIAQIEEMIALGATFIDIGAVSTRPGADLPDEDEEKSRLEPVLSEISKHLPDAFISLDTFRSSVARWAVEKYGISIINDVSGGNLDEDMFDTIAQLDVPYILMHMRGTPQTMTKESAYNNITREIILDLTTKSNQLQKSGVKDIILDPGIGFAKNINQNFELLHRLDEFYVTGLPLLIGLSRKSLVHKTLGCTPEDALNGTTVLNTLALSKGASILRVHDVKEAAETILMYQAAKQVG